MYFALDLMILYTRFLESETRKRTRSRRSWVRFRMVAEGLPRERQYTPF